MATLWGALVDVLEGTIFVLTQMVGGNIAWGIIAFSLITRVALLPLTCWAARRAQENQAKLAALRPALDRLRQLHRGNARRLMAASAKLYAAHDFKPMDPRALMAMVVQMPVFAVIFSALRRVIDGAAGARFFWISNIARPSMVLAVSVATLVYVVTLIGPQTASGAQQRVLVFLPAAITLLLLLKMSAGYGLYWGVSTMVGGVQAVLLRRRLQLPATGRQP